MKGKPDTRKCKSCIYWRKLSWGEYSRSACYFLLDTEARCRKDAAGKCLEYRERGTERIRHRPRHFCYM